MQDDRQRRRRRGSAFTGPAHRDEVEGAVHVGAAGRAQAEVRGGDRGREPVIEATCQAEPSVEAIPPRAQRELVYAQLVRVKEPVQLDGLEVRTTELLELLAAVLVYVPGVVRAGRAAWCERQHVRRRHEHRPLLADERTEMVEHRTRVLQVLDRLQEHDRVGRLGEPVDEIARVAEVRAGVAQAGMLVCLGISVDADDVRCGASEHVRAIALAAGHVDHALAPYLLRDPLVHDEVAAVPVVLLGNVRERALTRQRQRWDAVGLVALTVGRGGGTHLRS